MREAEAEGRQDVVSISRATQRAEAETEHSAHKQERVLMATEAEEAEQAAMTTQEVPAARA